MNLWGNKLDLSLSCGQVTSDNSKSLFDISTLDADLLADDSEKIWNAVSDTSGNSTIVGEFTSSYFHALKSILDWCRVEHTPSFFIFTPKTWLIVFAASAGKILRASL